MHRSEMLLTGFTLVAVVTFTWSGPKAQEPVGQIKTISGAGTVVRGSDFLRAEVGQQIYQKDRIKTGTNDSLGITFRDGTQVSLGASSDFAVQDFAFEPQKGKLSFIISLLKGSLVYISGRIASLMPQAVEIRTVNGTIGVRGTRFATRVPQQERGVPGAMP
jgi:hypothetical protein